MELIERTLEYGRKDTFTIYPLGDSHLGQVQAAEDSLKEKIEEIRTTKNAYWLGMGDLVDCILPHDKRWDLGLVAPWVEKQNIAESERQRAKEIFMPIAGKCLGLLDGNHEYNLKLYSHYDMTHNLCNDLKAPYAGYQCFLILTFKRKGSNESHVIKIHAWHGAGAAQTEGAQLLRLKRLVKEFDASVYFMGHLHSITHDITDRLAVVNHRIKQRPQIATITGSWLKGYQLKMNASYIERYGYRPSHLGCPRIKIIPDKQRILYESE